MNLKEIYKPIINEVFSGTSVKYGSDPGRSNRGWVTGGVEDYTFFIVDGVECCYWYASKYGEVGFGIRITGSSGSNDFNDYTMSKVSDINSRTTMKIFQHVVEISMELLKNRTPKSIEFSGMTTKHDSIYGRIMNSPVMQTRLKKLGYGVDNTDTGFGMFKVIRLI